MSMPIEGNPVQQAIELVVDDLAREVGLPVDYFISRREDGRRDLGPTNKNFGIKLQDAIERLARRITSRSPLEEEEDPIASIVKGMPQDRLSRMRSSIEEGSGGMLPSRLMSTTIKPKEQEPLMIELRRLPPEKLLDQLKAGVDLVIHRFTGKADEKGFSRALHEIEWGLRLLEEEQLDHLRDHARERITNLRAEVEEGQASLHLLQITYIKKVQKALLTSDHSF